MQNKYAGDIGDFGKYGLLKVRLTKDGSKLGIVWYLVPNEKHLKDGKHINYLNKDEFKICDPELFEKLKAIIQDGKREIGKIENSNILPTGTKFHSDLLTHNGLIANSTQIRNKIIELRTDWLNKAIEEVKGCDIVFLDPDNGLEIKSTQKHTIRAPKYVFYDEVREFLNTADSLVIYQHLGQQAKHNYQIAERKKELAKISGDSFEILALRFNPYSPRVYFIITKDKGIPSKAKIFANSNWKRCFELID